MQSCAVSSEHDNAPLGGLRQGKQHIGGLVPIGDQRLIFRALVPCSRGIGIRKFNQHKHIISSIARQSFQDGGTSGKFTPVRGKSLPGGLGVDAKFFLILDFCVYSDCPSSYKLEHMAA